MTKVFIDSNVWLYRLLIDPNIGIEEYNRKRQIAIQLTQPLDQSIVISTQVITETCAVLKRKAKFSDQELLEIIEEFEEQCQIITLTMTEIKEACQLRKKYNFSFWDSLIIACALKSQAKTIYSEDMQHSLVVQEQLTIINPFNSASTSL
ncbi:PIN domain-containing protein [Synechocystis sp. LEGE 06083]|uniref:PIN domain-containing protein n=2 Tax=unclassified Synechocystis TaxID=2640012 RepID=UPI001881ACC1|nr:PIN domain-containing protein [Synechocystis sp. LEGE 06083]MBE9193822.1 PIN domain-containing protein [Synechocystis sp. LEGE 06083]